MNLQINKGLKQVKENCFPFPKWKIRGLLLYVKGIIQCLANPDWFSIERL